MKRSFYPNIEGFRGLAILLVLLSHWIVIAYFPNFIFLKLGFLGVNFFFVLSGFLITEILLIDLHNKVKKKHILINFFAKRTLRIFPIYYITIIGLAIFNIRGSIDLLPWTLTYSLNIGQNWFGAYDKMFMHIWSLCVEEQFYLIWPFVLLLTRRTRYYKVILSFIIMSIVFKIVMFVLHWNNYEAVNHSNLIAAIDALAVGGMLAYLKRYNHYQWIRIENSSPYIALVLLFLFWFISFNANDFKLASTSLLRLLSACIASILIVKAVSQRNYSINKIIRTKAFKFLGKISYGVYLYHWIISFLLMGYFSKLWERVNFDVLGVFKVVQYHKYIGSFLFFLIVTIAVAIISYYCIEKPILKLKRFF
ncbi:acyltransferase [uncultured Psychroserpens sp.]|uniref:acyltransferase family protein n=1 Tax=uncultured Psychroserpens sp. TaxID=255436 RepID=UPI002621CD75|nr:acyltransferase [uncultured Psychroserpens sp.]